MIRPEDEEIFVLSDEIMDYIHGFFPRLDGREDRMLQSCIALKALINVIGIMLSEMDSDFTVRAVAGSFFKMLEDLSAIRAEIEDERKAASVH
jgi:hypothetical protein